MSDKMNAPIHFVTLPCPVTAVGPCSHLMHVTFVDVTGEQGEGYVKVTPAQNGSFTIPDAEPAFDYMVSKPMSVFQALMWAWSEVVHSHYTDAGCVNTYVAQSFTLGKL